MDETTRRHTRAVTEPRRPRGFSTSFRPLHPTHHTTQHTTRRTTHGARHTQRTHNAGGRHWLQRRGLPAAAGAGHGLRRVFHARVPVLRVPADAGPVQADRRGARQEQAAGAARRRVIPVARQRLHRRRQRWCFLDGRRGAAPCRWDPRRRSSCPPIYRTARPMP